MPPQIKLEILFKLGLILKIKEEHKAKIYFAMNNYVAARFLYRRWTYKASIDLKTI
jgi:hypothetical protein